MPMTTACRLGLSSDRPLFSTSMISRPMRVPPHAADAAGEAGAAAHHHGDDVEQVARPSGRLGGVEPADVDPAGHRRQRPRDDVHPDLGLADGQPGQSGYLLVPADGVQRSTSGVESRPEGQDQARCPAHP